MAGLGGFDGQSYNGMDLNGVERWNFGSIHTGLNGGTA